MSGRRNLGNVWKKAFMNTKTVEEHNITDDELELIQNTDPASDPHGCGDYRKRQQTRIIGAGRGAIGDFSPGL